MTPANWLTVVSVVCALGTATCAAISLWSVAHHLPRRVYRDGWLEGRIDLMQHMGDAAASGVPFDTFVRQVAARDGFVLPEDPDNG